MVEQTFVSVGMFIGSLIFMFGLVIGVYVWTFKVAADTSKQLGQIYESVNKHHQDADKHMPINGLVTTQVCTALHTALKEDVMEIKADVKELLRKS